MAVRRLDIGRAEGTVQTRDQLIEADQSRRLHKGLPRSLLHLVEDAGHMVTYGDSPGIADAVAALALTAPTPEFGGEVSAQIIRRR